MFNLLQIFRTYAICSRQQAAEQQYNQSCVEILFCNKKIQNTILFQLPKHLENEIMYFILKWNTILYFDRKKSKNKMQKHYLLLIQRCILFSESEIHLYFKNSKILFILSTCRSHFIFLYLLSKCEM